MPYTAYTRHYARSNEQRDEQSDRDQNVDMYLEKQRRLEAQRQQNKPFIQELEGIERDFKLGCAGIKRQIEQQVKQELNPEMTQIKSQKRKAENRSRKRNLSPKEIKQALKEAQKLEKAIAKLEAKINKEAEKRYEQKAKVFGWDHVKGELNSALIQAQNQTSFLQHEVRQLRNRCDETLDTMRAQNQEQLPEKNSRKFRC